MADAKRKKTWHPSRELSVDGDRFVLIFQYNKELIDEVKKLKGRRFDGDSKRWWVPLTSSAEVAQFCLDHGFKPDENAQAVMANPPDAEPTRAKNGSITVSEGKILISFDYDPVIVQSIKAISGRTWDAERKVWVAPLSSIRQVSDFAVLHGFEITDAEDVPDAEPVIEPTITEQGAWFWIKFPYDRDLVQRVRDLPDAKFDPDRKAWKVSKDCWADIVDFSTATNAVMDDALSNHLAQQAEKSERIKKSSAADAAFELPSLKCDLRPYQKAGVVYALEALGFASADGAKWEKVAQ
jgi:hypothetical protein